MGNDKLRGSKNASISNILEIFSDKSDIVGT